MVVKAPGENTKSRKKNSISETVKTLKDIKCGNFSGMLSREKGKKKSFTYCVHYEEQSGNNLIYL